MNTNNVGCKIEHRETIAEMLQNMASSISDYAKETESRVNCKLSPILSGQGDEKDLGEPCDPWPTLFSQLRDQLFSIRASLRSINKVMDRVEL